MRKRRTFQLALTTRQSWLMDVAQGRAAPSVAEDAILNMRHHGSQ